MEVENSVESIMRTLVTGETMNPEKEHRLRIQIMIDKKEVFTNMSEFNLDEDFEKSLKELLSTVYDFYDAETDEIKGYNAYVLPLFWQCAYYNKYEDQFHYKSSDMNILKALRTQSLNHIKDDKFKMCCILVKSKLTECLEKIVSEY